MSKNKDFKLHWVRFICTIRKLKFQLHLIGSLISETPQLLSQLQKFKNTINIEKRFSDTFELQLQLCQVKQSQLTHVLFTG